MRSGWSVWRLRVGCLHKLFICGCCCRFDVDGFDVLYFDVRFWSFSVSWSKHKNLFNVLSSFFYCCVRISTGLAKVFWLLFYIMIMVCSQGRCWRWSVVFPERRFFHGFWHRYWFFKCQTMKLNTGTVRGTQKHQYFVL